MNTHRPVWNSQVRSQEYSTDTKSSTFTSIIWQVQSIHLQVQSTHWQVYIYKYIYKYTFTSTKYIYKYTFTSTIWQVHIQVYIYKGTRRSRFTWFGVLDVHVGRRWKITLLSNWRARNSQQHQESRKRRRRPKVWKRPQSWNFGNNRKIISA